MTAVEINVISESELRERRNSINDGDSDNHYRPRLQSLIDQYGIVRPRLSILDRIKRALKNFYDSLTFFYIINAIIDRFPIIRCIREYDIRNNTIGDLIAGLTVAVMHIPQGTVFLSIKLRESSQYFCLGFQTVFSCVHGVFLSGIAYGVLANLAPVYGKVIAFSLMKSIVSKIPCCLFRNAGLYVSFFPVIIYMIFGTCPHLSVGEC